MSRYVDATKSLRRKVHKMQKNQFPAIKDAWIKTVLDAKKKKSQGRFRLAEIKATNDMDRFLSSSDGFDGYDFILIIDQVLYNNISESDLNRVLFHEFNHAHYDSETGKYKVVPHEIEGFYSEVKFNEDDPDWGNRLAEELQEYYRELENER